MLWLKTAGVLLLTGSAEANNSSVSIQQPVRIDDSGKAEIQCTVPHRGNNFLHHTEWLRVSSDGKELTRWNFHGQTNLKAQLSPGR